MFLASCRFKRRSSRTNLDIRSLKANLVSDGWCAKLSSIDARSISGRLARTPFNEFQADVIGSPDKPCPFSIGKLTRAIWLSCSVAWAADKP